MNETSLLPGRFTAIALCPSSIVDILTLTAPPICGAWEECTLLWLCLIAAVAFLAEVVIRKRAFGAQPVDLIVGAA